MTTAAEGTAMDDPRQSTATLEVRGLAKTYGTGAEAHEIFAGIDLTVAPREIVCIVGPSGVGKTTLLRCIGGLLAPTAGEVLVEGQRLRGPVPQIGIVFQDYSRSLLPWMRTVDNVAFPLESKGMKKSERIPRAEAALEAVGLAGSGSRYPWQLSGGMQQRAAIARAIAYEAEILLMDEPFASVDAQTRADLEDLALDLRQRLGVTLVLVTHDIDEAVYLSDRVVVLSGRPASVVDVVDIHLGDDRDQLTTKSLPEFTEDRARVLRQIRRP
ncbi:MAG: ABC transporter [Micrococcales bacterium 73-13]|nr:MAG: ABC transporter [Micrococcales bacterium 73-13]